MRRATDAGKTLFAYFRALLCSIKFCISLLKLVTFPPGSNQDPSIGCFRTTTVSIIIDRINVERNCIVQSVNQRVVRVADTERHVVAARREGKFVDLTTNAA